jgi:hypothetical protein
MCMHGVAMLPEQRGADVLAICEVDSTDSVMHMVTELA